MPSESDGTRQLMDSGFAEFHTQRDGHGIYSRCLDKLPIRRREIGGQKFRSTPRASAEVADDTLKQGDTLRKMSKRAEKSAGLKRQHGSSLKLIRVSCVAQSHA